MMLESERFYFFGFHRQLAEDIKIWPEFDTTGFTADINSY
jgi:hypothetical protein